MWDENPYDYVADESRSAARFASGPEPRHGHIEATPSATEAKRDDKDWRGETYR